MKSLILAVLICLFNLPVWADRGGVPHREARPQIMAARPHERHDSALRRYHPTGRERAMEVSRGRHRGWYQGNGNRRHYYRHHYRRFR